MKLRYFFILSNFLILNLSAEMKQTLKNKITFKIVDCKSIDYARIVSIREQILRKPLGLSYSEEERKKDKECIHVAGYMDNEIIATAMLTFEGKTCKMQRVAVIPEMQGKGIGELLLNFCHNYCLSHSINEIYCSARLTATNFYKKNGYITEGEIYQEVSIPHQKMRKILN